MTTGVSNGGFPYVVSTPDQVSKLIREHGDLFSESQCKVCSAVLISNSQKLAHYQSKKHASKVRRYMDSKGEEPAAKLFKSSSEPSTNTTASEKECNLCNMIFSSPVIANSHYQGKVHAKNLKMKNVSQSPVQPPKVPTKETTPASDGPDSKNDPNRFCSICQASFNNPLMAQQHYSGKKHKKHLTKRKLMETYGPSPTPASTVKGYPCSVCKIELNSVEQFQAHISGSKHKLQLSGGGQTNPGRRVMKASNTYGGPSENLRPDFRYGPDQQEEDWGGLKPGHEKKFVYHRSISSLQYHRNTDRARSVYKDNDMYIDTPDNHRPQYPYGYGRVQEDEDWGSLRHDYE